MRMKLTALLLLIPTTAGAGPILESAMQAADRTEAALVSPQCLSAHLSGQEAARLTIELRYWFLFGMVAPGITPLVAPEPTPPPVATIDVQCWQDGYRYRGKQRRKTASWVGSFFGLALYSAALITSMNEEDSTHRRPW